MERCYWYAQVCFKLEEEYEYYNEAIGIDINYNLFTTCYVKEDGNPSQFTNYTIDFDKLNSNQTKERLIQIARTIVFEAKRNKKNIAIEDIDLSSKKNEDNGKQTNRKIHLIAYRKFITYLKSCATKNKVFVKVVNPAYTSVIAKLKYALPLGRSVHECSALTIGRRSLKIKDRVPSKLSASLLQRGERMKHSWSQWHLVSKRLKQVSKNKKSLMFSDMKGSNVIWSLLTQSDEVGSVVV